LTACSVQIQGEKGGELPHQGHSNHKGKRACSLHMRILEDKIHMQLLEYYFRCCCVTVYVKECHYAIHVSKQARAFECVERARS